MRERFVLLFFVSFFLLLLPVEAPGQLVLGQYEDEAPARTWNAFGVGLAPALGWGYIQIAANPDVSGSLVNPALLLGLPRFSATVGGSFTSSTLFRYSVLNTGVLRTSGNMPDSARPSISPEPPSGPADGLSPFRRLSSKAIIGLPWRSDRLLTTRGTTPSG